MIGIKAANMSGSSLIKKEEGNNIAPFFLSNTLIIIETY